MTERARTSATSTDDKPATRATERARVAGDYDMAAVGGEPCRILLRLYDAAADGTSDPLDVRPSNFRGSVSYGPKMAADDLPDAIRFRAGDPATIAATVPALATAGRYWYSIQFRASASDAWQTILSGALQVAPTVAP